MLNRLLLVKDELAIVLNDLQWDNLPTSYWKQIENTNELLKPFAQYTQLMGSEEVTTISMIIPALMELDIHLEQSKSINGLSSIAAIMQEKLKEQFNYITNPQQSDFDPIFAICTFLNPEYKDILDEGQKSAAKVQLLSWINSTSSSQELQIILPATEDQASFQTSSLSSTDSESEPPSKKFRHVQELLAEKRRLGASQVVLKPEELEIKKYEEAEIDTNSFDDDPFTFWLHNQKYYPTLSMAAFDLLSTPATTTPVERIFSTGGNSTQGKRNRLTDSNNNTETKQKILTPCLN